MLIFLLQIANRLGVAVNQVSQVTIWGNHSSTQFPDARHAKVCIDGVRKPVYEAVNDDAWLAGDFVSVCIFFVDVFSK